MIQADYSPVKVGNNGLVYHAGGYINNKRKKGEKALPIVFINCSLFPFIQWILGSLKLFETRNRNTLKSLIGKTVYLAETGKGKRPVVQAIATIDSVIRIDNRKEYNRLRKYTCIPCGSIYDFIPGKTRYKYLYRLANVQPVEPFIPCEGVRHGRIWMEYRGQESTKSSVKGDVL